MVRKTFLYLAMLIIGKGMIWGNVVGLALCAVQKYTRLVGLNPQDYYLDCVPIEFNWPLIVTVNVVMFVLSVLILIVPSHLISRIYPTKAMRFE
jgi:lipoprotein-releasing system permease protein